MKLAASVAAKSPVTGLTTLAYLRPALQRTYATQTGLGKAPSPGPKRKSVTPFNDDGRVKWADLSVGEKAGRATQQSFNFGFILAGLGATVSATPPAYPVPLGITQGG